MSFVFSILAGICFIAGGLLVAAFWASKTEPLSLAGALQLIPVIDVVVTGFVFMAVSAGLSLLKRIEQNTSDAADVLEQLVSSGGERR